MADCHVENRHSERIAEDGVVGCTSSLMPSDQYVADSAIDPPSAFDRGAIGVVRAVGRSNHARAELAADEPAAVLAHQPPIVPKTHFPRVRTPWRRAAGGNGAADGPRS